MTLVYHVPIGTPTSITKRKSGTDEESLVTYKNRFSDSFSGTFDLSLNESRLTLRSPTDSRISVPGVFYYEKRPVVTPTSGRLGFPHVPLPYPYPSRYRWVVWIDFRVRSYRLWETIRETLLVGLRRGVLITQKVTQKIVNLERRSEEHGEIERSETECHINNNKKWGNLICTNSLIVTTLLLQHHGPSYDIYLSS